MCRLEAKAMGEVHRDQMNSNWRWGIEGNTKRSLRQQHYGKSQKNKILLIFRVRNQRLAS